MKSLVAPARSEKRQDPTPVQKAVAAKKKAKKAKRPAKAASKSPPAIPFEVWLVDRADGSARKVSDCPTRELAESWRAEWMQDDLGCDCEVRRDGEVLPPMPAPAVVQDDALGDVVLRYELWLGCEDYELAPELVYKTDSLEDLQVWRREVDGHRYSFELTAKLDGSPFTIPPAEPLRMPSHDDAHEQWVRFQRDDFVVYDLRGTCDRNLVDRQPQLRDVVRHMLDLWVNTDPMGGYFIEERQAMVAPSTGWPKRLSTTYSVWFVDKDTGELEEEYDAFPTLTQAEECVRETEELNAEYGDGGYSMKILRAEWFAQEEGGAE